VRTGRAGRIGIAVLAVLLAAAIGLTAWLYFFQYRVDQQTGPAGAATALKAAQDGAVAVLSYSPESLDKDLANAKSHLTGDFLNYYTNFTNDVVRPAVQQKGVKTEAKVVSSAISEMHPDKAVALLFVNQTTASKDRDDPSLAASSVRVTLDKVDGIWLISSFDPV
jgi:Mce-associated membrane protein